MVPPAPPTFSTTICWPSVRPIGSAISRATVSVGPPAAAGTTMVMGRRGIGLLRRAAAAPATNTAPSAAKVLAAGRARVWPRPGQFLLGCMSLSLEMAGWKCQDGNATKDSPGGDPWPRRQSTGARPVPGAARRPRDL